MKIPGVFAVERKYLLKNTPAEQLIGIVKENQTELKNGIQTRNFLHKPL